MRKAYTYRISLTKWQQRVLNQMLEECRYVYNQTLAARIYAWEQRQESLSLYDTQSLLPAWKVDRPSLKLVHSQVFQNVQLRLDLAFIAFFRRVKACERDVGYPLARRSPIRTSFAPKNTNWRKRNGNCPKPRFEHPCASMSSMRPGHRQRRERRDKHTGIGATMPGCESLEAHALLAVGVVTTQISPISCSPASGWRSASRRQRA